MCYKNNTLYLNFNKTYFICRKKNKEKKNTIKKTKKTKTNY